MTSEAEARELSWRLRRAGDRWTATRAAEADARAHAKDVALEALGAGFSEVYVAATIGADRMTVRKWAGKR